MSRCARPQCGRELSAPDSRRRYCSTECGNAERQQRKRDKTRVCKNCCNPTPDRFCSKPCRWSYLQRIRKSNRTAVAALEPVSVLLPFGSNPRQTTGQPEGSGDDRRVYCRRYERCLSFAVSKRWSGFGCQQCAVTELDIPALTRKRNNWE